MKLPWSVTKLYARARVRVCVCVCVCVCARARARMRVYVSVRKTEISWLMYVCGCVGGR